MTTPETKVHWNQRPEFHADYMPWCDQLIQSEAVRDIVAKSEADKLAINNCGAKLLPQLGSIGCKVNVIVDGSLREYTLCFQSKDKDSGDDNEDKITLTPSEDTHSIILYPGRQSGYKVAMSVKKTRPPHVLMGGPSHSYGPEPLIDQPGLRDYVEELVDKVSTSLIY